MSNLSAGADIAKSALIVVDMQNDFLHPDGGFARRARDNPEAGIDMPFLTGTIPRLARLAGAFRAAGRPVVYVTHALRADYSDAQFPHWRSSRGALTGNRTFLVEGSFGVRVVDELAPAPGEPVVVKKGYGGFSNTPLDTILRALGVTTCVVGGVTTCVCVSSTVRGGVEHNYRMIVAGDAAAEIHRDAHEAELKILGRAFADVRSTDEIVDMLARVRREV